MARKYQHYVCALDNGAINGTVNISIPVMARMEVTGIIDFQQSLLYDLANELPLPSVIKMDQIFRQDRRGENLV